MALSLAGTSFDDLVERQDGVVRRSEAVAHLGRHAVAGHLRQRRWQLAHTRVVVVHNGPLSGRQQAWVAVLAAPDGSALGGLAAARWDGLSGFEALAPADGAELDVVMPQGSKRISLDGARVHWSSRMGPEDVHTGHLPRRTRISRSLVDAAVWAPHDRWARALVIAGVQQRLVRPGDELAALSRRGPCLRHAVILESIEDARGGVHSVPEADFARTVRAGGLPEPTRQVVVRRRDGRYYLDAEWAAYGLSVEIQGVQHVAALQADADLDRINEFTAGGRRILLLTSYDVRRRESHVIALLARALRAGGWRG